MRALLALVLFATAEIAHADGGLCARGTRHRGALIDLDLKDADIHDVLRLIADTAHTNLVVSDDVGGKVTLKLHRVPWDQAVCVIAASHKLTVTVDGNILLVTTSAAAPGPHRQRTATPN